MKKIMMSFLVVFTLGLILFVYEPITFYVMNHSDFYFDIIASMKLFFVFFVIFFGLYFFIYLVSRKLGRYSIYYVLLNISYIILFGFIVQGLLLTNLLPSLDGNIIEWSEFHESFFYSSLCWLIIVILVGYVCFKYGLKRCTIFFNKVVTVICVIFLLSIVITFFKFDLFDYSEELSLSFDNINIASNNKNFMIFLVDAVDSREFNSVMDSKTFEDFTYYPDTLSAYPYTRDSIPFILSGIWNNNETDFFKYSNIAYSNSSFLKELSDRNYDINFYLSDLYFDDSDKFISNSFICKYNNKEFSGQYLRYLIFKYFPHSLKKYADIEHVKFSFCGSGSNREYSYYNRNLYKILNDNKINKIDKNYFQFIHVEGAHLPFDSDSEFNHITNGTYSQKVEASFNLIKIYLERLKESDVYDNSVIIILSDHGYCEENIFCRVNPILFVKGVDEHHDMYTSDISVSYDDLSDAYFKLLDGKSSSELFNNVNHDDGRRLLAYYFTKEDEMYEYRVFDKAWNVDGFEFTGKVFKLKLNGFVFYILGDIIKYIYDLFNNYGIAIIVFTLFSKFVLLPISMILHKNSIKMAKILPIINRIKIKYFLDKDKIAEEEAKLYKEKKYNPIISIIPLVIQILLLIGLVEIINHPVRYIIKVPDYSYNKMVDVALKNHSNLSEESSMIDFTIIDDIKNNNFIDDYRMVYNYSNYSSKIKKFNLTFMGVSLDEIAFRDRGIFLLVPIIAGISAFVLCLFQNRFNVLQLTQSKFNKYSMMIISVGLSLYLGLFVSVGIVLYWIVSNILAIIQQLLLNWWIDPKKYVDIDEINNSKSMLNEFIDSNKNEVKRTREEVLKERRDYKRFFSIDNKHLVFYSESNGFFKYYKGIIMYLIKHSNVIIHYITSDFNDDIFKLEKKYSNINAYYIGEKKLITLMMKMDAYVVVMTMPDLDNYHIKRSYVNKDIEYIFIPHSMDSLNMTMRCRSMNNFDTVFVTGAHQKDEAIATNNYYNLNRKIVEWGYSLLDDMIKDYNEVKKRSRKKKTILIAPSWQKDNIIDLCLKDMLNILDNGNYKIIVRPHPQHVKHEKEKFEKLKKKYLDNSNIDIQTDFTSNDIVFNADLLITDWSGIAYEYAFTTKKPVIFIDTPMKVMNFDYKKIDVEPFNIWVRDTIGKVVSVSDVNNLDKYVSDILKSQDSYTDSINRLISSQVYNLGDSSRVGAYYIVNTILKKINDKKKL